MKRWARWLLFSRLAYKHKSNAMNLSIFDMFKIGIGPSSSHTVGPMRAAKRFVERLDNAKLLVSTTEVKVELYGSLGFTGKGHGSDSAVMMGLLGHEPQSIDPDVIPAAVEKIVREGQLTLEPAQRVRFIPAESIVFHRRDKLPLHSNGMRFTALDSKRAVIHESIFYSVGGGFVVNGDGQPDNATLEMPKAPYPFETGDDLLRLCNDTGYSISTVVAENEKAFRPEAQTQHQLQHIWAAMKGCVQRGCEREGVLPGGLKVKRRAATLYRRLRAEDRASNDPLAIIDWVNLWALAVNEENAAGGRVVTAPTNGAAGIVPAVLHYYVRFVPNADEAGVLRFLHTAAAIGMLYKMRASISGAEVGCQGEVGVACSMAAAGLAEVMGGTPEQVENAAEIGMEHNLGLTCDPIGGLVQVPCIERNAMGSVKAMNAARLALSGDGKHKVSLDKVIATMRQTGADMSTKYKETARGGLAVNIIEC
jgi:L-serine dehydratase